MSSTNNDSANIEFATQSSNAAVLIVGPSIFQQRVILIAFVVAISAAAWWQNAGDSLDSSVKKFTTTPIPKVLAELDFTDAETAWSSLQIDPEGNLQIDALTESALLEAIALISAQASEQQMARMGMLLEKQFGASTSQQIMALVPLLKNYKEMEQRWWEQKGSENLSANTPPPYAELFQLQDELLGEALAKRMFAEQRRLAKMMLASQQIQNDASLTQAQKERALMNLQHSFQGDSVQQENQEEAQQESQFEALQEAAPND